MTYSIPANFAVVTLGFPVGDEWDEGGADFCLDVSVLAHAKTANKQDKNA